jgi:cyclopropane fatty-acyl-phospholipid synthase-like methyltransferase
MHGYEPESPLLNACDDLKVSMQTPIEDAVRMKLSYADIFKYSDILNPISPHTLLAAGTLAELTPDRVILDLGSGKGTPALLWASLFGVHVEGYDLTKSYVEYANARAKLLNLSHRVQFFCKDVRELKVTRKHDVVASLGLGIAHAFGSVDAALQRLRTMVRKGGFLILAEPVWLARDISSEVLDALDAAEEHFLTRSELSRVLEERRFHVEGSFDSSKADWELYIRPVRQAMEEIIERADDRAREAQGVMDSFQAEYDAVNQYWNMVVWVAKAL